MKAITILTAALGLTISAYAGGSARWNPYTNGWDYTDQYGQPSGSSTYNPYTNGYQFRDQYGQPTGSATYNPYTNSWNFRDQ